MRQSLSRRRFLAGTGAACAAALTGSAAAAAHPTDEVPSNADARPTPTPAPDDLKSLVDDLVETSLNDHDVPGATVAVVAGGEVVITEGYGVADRESDDPVDPAGTPFRIGSVSKPVVATALMRLVQRGEVDPDADVTQYLDVPIDDAYDDPVTLRHLVTHRAGFEATNEGLWIPDTADLRTLDAYLRDGQRARVRPPGEAGSYSNYGYALAGSILAATRDEPFHANVAAELLDPAGMTTSSFQQPLPSALADAHATGYGSLGAVHDGRFPYVGLRPAGAMSSTASDMARFLQLHLNDGIVNGERVLDSGTVDALHEQWATPHEQLDGMAFGFVEEHHGDVRTLWHNGATLSFYSHLVLVPEQDLGLFVSYNASGGGAAANDVVDRFLDELLPTPDEQTLSPDGSPTRAADLGGTYRSLQQSHTWHDRTTSVLNASTLSVSVADDGALVTADGSTTTRWIEIEPLVFERVDGQRRLAFGDHDGDIEYLSINGSPTAYGRITGLEQLSVHGALAVITLLGMFSAILGWPGASIVRQSRDDATPDWRDWLRDPTVQARLVAGGSAVTLFGGLVLVIGHFLLTPLAALSAPSFTFRTLFLVQIAGALAALAAVAYAARMWYEGHGSLLGRTHYTIVTASLLGFSWLLWYWNLLLPPG